uniref:Uncharacterized protein n=1 Tax=Myotis myotis TaxID=51298 RepID=A0A7J7VHZ5_MYOMY|nr:hypothetical protein mMyoMyo1_008292 [Myotis myotis]
MTVATVSPDCLRGTTAAAAQVFKDPSRVPSGEAPVLSHSSRRDAAVAVVLFADCFRVFAETKLLVFTPSFLKLAAAVTGSAVCPPHERAGAAAAVPGCVPPRVAKVAAAVDGDPLLKGAFQRPDSGRRVGAVKETSPWKRINFRLPACEGHFRFLAAWRHFRLPSLHPLQGLACRRIGWWQRPVFGEVPLGPTPSLIWPRLCNGWRGPRPPGPALGWRPQDCRLRR